MKAIAILRVSTEGQRIDEQKEELITFLRGQGYDEIIPIEAVGASAIKMDDKYMELVNRVKTTIIEDNTIKAAGVWELSRLGRNEVILFQFKEFFIKHKIQFICKQPYMRLLDDDGGVNTGTELAFSLFATMSKQEMEEKKARFKRAKDAMLKKGQSIGGNTRKFGYRVGDDKYFVEDEEEGRIVRMVYDMYSTGNYSSYSLAKELNERGIQIDDRKVIRILGTVAYIGEDVCDSGLHYPQIISRELWDKCREIREANRIEMKRGQKLTLCAKLVKCPVCGATCTSNSKHYSCSRHAHHGACPNGFALRQYVADDLAWRVAFPLHLDYLMALSEDKKEQYRKEKEVVEEKIAEAQRKMDDFSSKKDRIVEAFLEGLIDRKNRDLRLSKLQDEVRVHQEYLSGLQGKREALVRMLEDDRKDDFETFATAYENIALESKYDIIHRHIEKIVAVQESYGKRDPRTTRPNAVKITVTSVYGQSWDFMYFPKFYDGHNLYVWNGTRWVADMVTKAVYWF